MKLFIILLLFSCTVNCGDEGYALKPGMYEVDVYFHRDDWDNQTLTEMKKIKWQVGWADGKQLLNVLGSSIVHESEPDEHEVKFIHEQVFSDCLNNTMEFVLVSDSLKTTFRGYGDALFYDTCSAWELLTVVEFYGHRIGDLP